MKVICTPSRDNVCLEFAYDLANLIRHDPEVIFTVCRGSILPNLRNTLVQTALKNGATHILFIDSDMRFPSTTFERLMKHDLPIVGANCQQRTQEEFTARINGEFISSIGRTGIEQVDTLGFGVTLIKAEVFRKLSPPYFVFVWDGAKFAGEDVSFCEEVREVGFSIYIDHDLSQEIKHIGTKEYGIE